MSWLAQNKDLLAALTSIASCILLIVAGTASYYRFFKGRTLAARADLDLSVSVHPTANGEIFHCALITVKNIGPVPIWEPTAWMYVSAWALSDEESQKHTKLRSKDAVLSFGSKKRKQLHVVDSGESATFLVHSKFPTSVWAVTHVVVVTSKDGEQWQDAVTVSNILKNEAAV